MANQVVPEVRAPTLKMDQWLHSPARQKLFRLTFPIAVWGNLAAFGIAVLASNHSLFPFCLVLGAFIGLPAVLSLLIFVAGMFLSALSSKRENDLSGVLWALVIAALNILAASAYYLIVYRRDGRAEQLEYL
jgi:hypothetical protein